jgi:hydrogenase small subunit
MSDANGSCGNIKMRLETASVLVHKAIDAIDQKRIKKGNLIWLELTG